MSRFRITKDLPFALIVEADDEDAALAVTDDLWRRLSTRVQNYATEALVGKLPDNVLLEVGDFYDNIDVASGEEEPDPDHYHEIGP